MHERLTFEQMAMEMQQGYRPKQSTEQQQYTRSEVIDLDYADLIKQELLPVKRVLESHERMVVHAEAAELPMTQDSELPPYSISIFSLSELIPQREKGVYKKLRIPKEYLLPELAQKFSHVQAETIEFDVWMLQALEADKRIRILKTIAKWEELTGFVVRFEGVVGHPAESNRAKP